MCHGKCLVYVRLARLSSSLTSGPLFLSVTVPPLQETVPCLSYHMWHTAEEI